MLSYYPSPTQRWLKYSPKANSDWSWNAALHRQLLLAGPVEYGYSEDRVAFNGIDHTIDVMGRQGDEFNIIIDYRGKAEVWVIASAQKTQIMVRMLARGTLVPADEEAQKTARAVMALWEK